jgi:hypothetical protein
MLQCSGEVDGAWRKATGVGHEGRTDLDLRKLWSDEVYVWLSTFDIENVLGLFGYFFFSRHMPNTRGSRQNTEINFIKSFSSNSYSFA